jgi:hypothetical protein
VRKNAPLERLWIIATQRQQFELACLAFDLGLRQIGAATHSFRVAEVPSNSTQAFDPVSGLNLQS